MDKLEYVARQLSRGTNKVYENYVINAIYQKVNNPNLKIETQKEIVLDNGYRPLIDMFLPQLNIAIEVDERQHAGQKEHDLWREKEIISQVLSSTDIGNEIQFERIIVYGNVTLEDVNKRIDEVVDVIKNKIGCTPLEWKNHEEEKKDFISKGRIEEGDIFYTNFDIINIVYKKNYKSRMRATYKQLWFPVISEYDKNTNLKTNTKGWENYYNNDHSIIYERNIENNTNNNKRDWFLKESASNKIRIVFAKEKDIFNKTCKKFVGVYRLDSWDRIRNALVWKRIDCKISIPIKEDNCEN